MLGFFVAGSSVCGFADEGKVIADFESGEAVSNLGQGFEVWLKDSGADKTQGAAMSIVEAADASGGSGKVLQVDYDVDSEGPAYNGVRFNLGGFDGSAFKSLSFDVRGDSPSLKIEMIGANKRPSPWVVNDITPQWQKVTIPFSDFFGIRDWTALDQLVIVFADILNDPKTGTFYFDNFSFEN